LERNGRGTRIASLPWKIYRILRFAQNEKRRTTAAAKTTADPYGMTNKKATTVKPWQGHGNGKNNSRSLRDDKQKANNGNSRTTATAKRRATAKQ
jgi:hypothetical protein